MIQGNRSKASTYPNQFKSLCLTRYANLSQDQSFKILISKAEQVFFRMPLDLNQNLPIIESEFEPNHNQLIINLELE